jgi:ABC-2 type transport system permease protein
MNARILVAANPRAWRPLRLQAAEAKYELLKAWRQPAYVIPTLGFPLVFYVMFGIVLNGAQHVGGVGVSTYMLATYGTFGVMAAAVFGFAVGVAAERGLGWLQVKQASPMPALAYVIAKMLAAMLFGMFILAGLLALGALWGGVHLAARTALCLGAVLVAGAIPFSALGLALGCLASPTGAPAVANAICLPMSFCSGLWLPLPMLPAAIQHAARFLPAYHLGQLALWVIGAPAAGRPAVHAAMLAGFTLLFAGVALWRFRAED